MLPLRMERVPDGGRLIAAPTEGWLPTGGWGHPPLRGCRDGPVLLPGAGPRPARGRTLCAPTAENGPRMLVRQTQAQKWDRAGSNFLPAQAPSGAGRNRAQALLILRAGNVLLTSRGNPRNRGPGVRRIWTRSVHPEPSPGDPLVSFPSMGKKLAARRRRNPPASQIKAPSPAA